MGDKIDYDSVEPEPVPEGDPLTEVEKSYIRNLQRERRIERGEPMGSLEDSGDSPDAGEDSAEQGVSQYYPPLSYEEERDLRELRRKARIARGDPLGSLEDSEDSPDGEDWDSYEREEQRARLEAMRRKAVVTPKHKKRKKRGYDKGFISWLTEGDGKDPKKKEPAKVRWYGRRGKVEWVTMEEYVKRKFKRKAQEQFSNISEAFGGPERTAINRQKALEASGLDLGKPFVLPGLDHIPIGVQLYGHDGRYPGVDAVFQRSNSDTLDFL